MAANQIIYFNVFIMDEDTKNNGFIIILHNLLLDRFTSGLQNGPNFREKRYRFQKGGFN